MISVNKYLNIYKTYTKVNKENYQLEYDLTRALAIVLSLLFILESVDQFINVYETMLSVKQVILVL